MPGDVLAHQIIPLVEALEAYGADADRALTLAALTRAEIAEPSSRLDGSVEQRIWQAAVAVTEDPQIGLKLAPVVRHGALGAYEYMLRNGGTLAETLAWADQYMHLVDTRTRIAVRVEDELAIARVSRDDGSSFVAQGIECLFAAIARLARERLAPGLRVVSFVHAPIGPQQTYADVFGCPVHFEAEAYEVAIGAQTLQAPLQGADPGLGKVLEEHVQGLLAAAPNIVDNPESIVERARAVLDKRLGGEPISVEALAKTLAVSPRTLRRKLDAAGTSYSALLDALRRQRASQWVAQTDEPLAVIAERLGFSDPSTFYRAFKRWTAVTPAQYRKRARG